MADALTPNVYTRLTSASVAGHTQHMRVVKTNVGNSNSLVRHSMARQVDEPSPQQARAIDKILRLPTGPSA